MNAKRLDELRDFLNWEISQAAQQLDGADRVGHTSAKVYADGLGKLKDLLALIADYEAALPLLEVVKRSERLRYVNLWKNLPTEQVFSNDGIRDILRAAHAYRERSQPNE